MTTDTEPNHTTEPESTTGTAGSMGRRQIAALSDLVELSNISDRTERAIDEKLETRLAWLQRRRERTRERADTRSGNRRRGLKAEHERRRVELRTAAEGAAAKTGRADAERRARAAAQANEAERKVRGEYDHERWVADSVLEGQRSKLKAQRAVDADEDRARREHAEAVAYAGRRRVAAFSQGLVGDPGGRVGPRGGFRRCGGVAG